jgi:ribosomal protein L11 methylase PrmA
MARKEQLVGEMLDRCRARTVWDLGANTGRFSRIAADGGLETVALEADPACVELLFRDGVERGEERILPLVVDLTNPSPGIGWANLERAALVDRGPADVVLALALVHHLAIANNVPLPRIASFLARLGPHLIVEFVPKGDPQIERLLRNREDIFADYHEGGFEQAFGRAFAVERKERLPDSPRVLYLLRAREGGA